MNTWCAPENQQEKSLAFLIKTHFEGVFNFHTSKQYNIYRYKIKGHKQKRRDGSGFQKKSNWEIQKICSKNSSEKVFLEIDYALFLLFWISKEGYYYKMKFLCDEATLIIFLYYEAKLKTQWDQDNCLCLFCCF